MLKMLNEALVLVINAYYEKELKVIGLASEKWSNQKGSDGDSYVAKYIRNIKFNLQLSNCEEDNIAGHIRRDFTKVRNLIAHDIEGDILLQKGCKQRIPLAIPISDSSSIGWICGKNHRKRTKRLL